MRYGIFKGRRSSGRKSKIFQEGPDGVFQLRASAVWNSPGISQEAFWLWRPEKEMEDLICFDTLAEVLDSDLDDELRAFIVRHLV